MAKGKSNRGNRKLDGVNLRFNNGAKIEAFYKNPNINVTTKLLIAVVNIYTLPENENKSDEEKFFASNTSLAKQFDLSEKNGPRTVQKTIVKLEEAGLIEDRLFLSNGELISHKENNVVGLIKRYVKLNTPNVKDQLKAMKGDSIYETFEPRSIQKRMANQRPITYAYWISDQEIDGMIEAINNVRIEEIKKQNKLYEKYLEAQAEKYGDFSFDASYELSLEQLEDPKTQKYLKLLSDLTKPGVNPALDRLIAERIN